MPCHKYYRLLLLKGIIDTVLSLLCAFIVSRGAVDSKSKAFWFILVEIAVFDRDNPSQH